MIQHHTFIETGIKEEEEEDKWGDFTTW